MGVASYPELLFNPIGSSGEPMNWQRRVAALFVILALAGCAAAPAGPRQVQNTPHQQDDPRDTGGMH